MPSLFVAALAAALWYSVWNIHAFYTIQGTTLQSLVIGLYFGIIFGNIPDAMAIAASIQSLYLGLVMSGGTVPSDQGIAACVAIPVALLNGLDASTAISFALPVGLLGGILVNIRYMIAGLFVERCERCADNADGAGITRNAVVYPAIIIFLMYFPIVFSAVYFGTGFIENVLMAIPEWLSHGLSVAGGILPAIGFALIIMVIGQPKLIPMFIIGFFMVQYLGLNVMACAVFAICIALLVTFMSSDGSSDDAAEIDALTADGADGDSSDASTDHIGILTTADVNRFFWRWYAGCEIAHCYERMQALNLCAAYVPALEKLYGDDKEKLAAAYHRHLAYFNIQAIWGGAVLGVALAMEEGKALTGSMTEEEADAAINGLKTGFMGPLSGVGDVIDWGTLQVLLLGLGMPFATDGSWIGAVIPMLFIPITLVEGFFFTNLGYRLGSSAMEQLLSSGLIEKLISTTGMIGMMMMGALGSTYVKVALASESAQATLDSVLPGILALGVIFLLNRIISAHKDKVAWVSFGIIGVSLVLSALGIL